MYYAKRVFKYINAGRSTMNAKVKAKLRKAIKKAVEEVRKSVGELSDVVEEAFANLNFSAKPGAQELKVEIEKIAAGSNKIMEITLEIEKTPIK
jgi:uncharacterized phage infection (PIP) family protein YhgE